ncbi:hypothetical protein CKAN_00174900 [Cinnamomum micranthum f. kanehirae]|uniref:Uncharacterized protein n=1 Tax=Cinnamomum micranthum f. kanehirae TaxID=337451 RepID=A0A443N4M3_9MAGN|nr:hypothetical protein CKAN_00174900 [Cinnamomum micranthum f. kanehirae]
MFRPLPNLQYAEELRRVHRWVPQRESGDQMATMQMLREAIDRLGSHESPDHSSRSTSFDTRHKWCHYSTVSDCILLI